MCVVHSGLSAINKDIYLSKVRTICLVPDADADRDWLERNLEKSAATLLQNVDLFKAFEGLREVFFEYVTKSWI